MAIVVGSAHLSDEGFLAAFASGELPLSSFRHGDHLRLAWQQLHCKPFNEAMDAVREGIRAYAAFHGVSHIYHETVTQAWVRLLATHHEASFEEFLMENEARLNMGLLHRFWSEEILQSKDAQVGWVAPDKAELPQ